MVVCPYCDEELEEEEACIFYGSEDTEPVWVCKNRMCDNFDEIIYCKGDLESNERGEE